jgi:two-component system chemotaxis response regulator CheY
MGQDLRSALVFESTWQQRSLLADVLRGEGFSLISRAATLHDAMTQTEAIAFEVAFVEVSLRAEAGFEFIRSIRFDRCGERRRLPIMVVSADAHRSLIARVRDAGANGFIVKPFSRASPKSGG